MKYHDFTKYLATSLMAGVLLVGCNSADDSDKTISDLPLAADKQDSDGDKILDGADNCPKVSNNDQKDTDGDNLGDACDNDLDGDGTLNDFDNCPSIFNPDQKNTDFDQDNAVDGKVTGDLCDPFIDQDQDGIAQLQPNLPNCGQNGSAPPNCNDNCPTVANANQLNTDGDNSGNACEDDADQDGILDNAFGANATCTGGNAVNCNDNCLNTPNPDQKDDNWNSIGNKCDNLVHCTDLGGGDSVDLLPIYNQGTSTAIKAAAPCSPTAPPGTCTSTNTDDTVDSDAANFATITVSDVGGQQSITLSIKGFGTKGLSTKLDIDNNNAKEDGRVGFVIGNPTTQFSAEFFSSISVATYLKNAFQEGTSAATPLQVDFFEQQSAPPGAPRVFLAISPITKDFDEVRLTMGAAAPDPAAQQPPGGNAQLSRNIYGACYSNVYKAPTVPPSQPENAIVAGCRSNDGPAQLCDGMATFFSEVESAAPADAVAACQAIATGLMQDPSQCAGFSAIPVP